MSRKDLGFVGTDPARRAHVERVLEGSDIEITVQVPNAGDTLRRGLSAPAVALLDASATDVDQAIAGVALLDAAWPETEVVVLHDDTDPAVVRSILDAGAVSMVTTSTSDRQLRATI